MSVDRRGEVLEHAIAIVRESGIAGLTMKKVAARVGFTEPAAYRYYESKQVLLEGIAQELGRRLLGPARALAAGGGPAARRLEAVVRHHVDFVLELDGLPILLLSEAAARSNGPLLACLQETVGEHQRLLADLLDELPLAKGAGRAGELALLLMGIPAVLAIRRRIGADRAAEKRVRDELVPFIVGRLAGA